MRRALPTVLLLAVAACSGDNGSVATTIDELFPDVVDVVVTVEPGGTFRFDVTISSPYDSVSQYADAWRIVGEDGTIYGVRELSHHHATEQPFTRSLGGVVIPEDVETVRVEGRDLVNGWGGETFQITLG